MRYLALIYTDENAVWSDEETQEVMAAYYAFGEEGARRACWATPARRCSRPRRPRQ
ncbi:MAG: hypothetical protein ACRDJL_05620 [Actinomycetota bacterium]